MQPAKSFEYGRGIPPSVWALGFVSMLMDISSEMIHALLPVYLVVGLGASMITVGLIEGIAEATASITKIFSGALSDWLGKRKLLAAIGYGLAAFTKPIFPLAPTVGWLVFARFVDRIGKGIRGAPRDALVADVTPPEKRGASFGLRQSLDTVGAFLGPLLAIYLMWITADHFQTVFWIAVIPAFAALLLLLVAVKEPQRSSAISKIKMPFSRSELSKLALPFWWIVVIASLFGLARFSEAFLILKAQAVGLPLVLVPGVLILMNLVYAMSAYPAGLFSDKVDRFHLLLAGLVFLIAADLFLAFGGSVLTVSIGVMLWGLHMGFTQGLLAALVADTAPAELRGTAFGIFNLMLGISALLASVLAGILWQLFGPLTTFLAGAGFSLLTCAIVVWIRKHRV